jgi:hypothetical protein
MIVEVKFPIGQPVNIPELDRPGVVIGIHIGDDGITYNVRYFFDGEALTVYFYVWELSL